MKKKINEKKSIRIHKLNTKFNEKKGTIIHIAKKDIPMVKVFDSRIVLDARNESMEDIRNELKDELRDELKEELRKDIEFRNEIKKELQQYVPKVESESIEKEMPIRSFKLGGK